MIIYRIWLPFNLKCDFDFWSRGVGASGDTLSWCLKLFQNKFLQFWELQCILLCLSQRLVLNYRVYPIVWSWDIGFVHGFLSQSLSEHLLLHHDRILMKIPSVVLHFQDFPLNWRFKSDLTSPTSMIVLWWNLTKNVPYLV